MRRLSVLICTLFFVSCAYSIDADKIWGVWNLGEKDDAIFTTRISLGTYLRTGNFLIFDPNDDGNRTIKYDGGVYRIKSVEPKDDFIVLMLEYNGVTKQPDGTWKKGLISGSVIMYFIDNNHVWFDIDDVKTDPDFSEADFLGRSIVYWRAIEKK